MKLDVLKSDEFIYENECNLLIKIILLPMVSFEGQTKKIFVSFLLKSLDLHHHNLPTHKMWVEIIGMKFVSISESC